MQEIPIGFEGIIRYGLMICYKIRQIRMAFTKKAWSAEEEMEMLSSVRRREPFDRIAQKHDRTQNAIRLRFGLVCKKELEHKNMTELCRDYNVDETQITQCINALENIQKKNQQPAPPHHFDPADVSIIKEEILVLNEKLDKIYKYVRKLVEMGKKTPPSQKKV